VASAVTGEVTGQINTIRSHDLSVSSDWISLTNVTAGSCGQSGGNAAFLFKDDERGKRHLSIAIAAKLAGKAVSIGYDDTGLQSGGFCFIRYIDLK